MYLFVEKNKNLFLETKNPLYAWKSFEHAIGFKYPIPDEILDYMFEVARKLSSLTRSLPKPAQRPLAIAKALKLHKTGAGQGSVFTEYLKCIQDRKIALATAKKIEYYGPDKADYAFDDIAKEYCISKSTVRRNFLAHSKRWNVIARQLIEKKAVTYGSDGLPQMMAFGTADDLRETGEILKEIERIQISK